LASASSTNGGEDGGWASCVGDFEGIWPLVVGETGVDVVQPMVADVYVLCCRDETRKGDSIKSSDW